MPTALPPDYSDRVYAGVLGKLIGVYLGRPIEGWSYRDVLSKIGLVNYYVHDRRGVELIVTDDDISGTFAFLRALDDHPHAGRQLTAEQVGQTWLNYIIDNKTILWWGGMGLSTEHTAFIRLQDGIAAPRSGSAELNGRLVAEQIGAQIFIDGWAMVAPGDPDLAVSLARRAASVSHDGEAILAAQVVAAMEAQAFVERDLNKLFDVGVSYIPKTSIIYRVIDDLRAFRAKTDDWQRAMTEVVEPNYGYDKYGGNCHVVPNHALIALALLWGDDDFQKSLMIANTCGWDTDCNSGNVGCLMGIKNGLAGIEAGPDWRGPVAERLYLPTADAGGCMTDAANVALAVENAGRRLAGRAPREPKDGARFHFSFPGSVQGFVPDKRWDAHGTTTVSNDAGRLAITYHKLALGRVARATTATFSPPEKLKVADAYKLICSPTLNPGQRMTSTVQADPQNDRPALLQLFLRHYDGADALVQVAGPSVELMPGDTHDMAWTIPQTGGQPIAEVGFEIRATGGASGAVYVDRLHWTGAPTVTLTRPQDGGTAWTRAWAEGVSSAGYWVPDYQYRVTQNRGRGLHMYGTRDWTDYTVATTVLPVLATAVGLAARVQGMRRYYALLLTTNADRRVVQLVKMRDVQTVLSEAPADWALGERGYAMSLTVQGTKITGTLDGQQVLTATDAVEPLKGGGIAIVIEEGRAHAGPIEVTALSQ
ncbi:MAG TPA: ADP-ribosylglycohydrolase family protein [Tepidisphaeraceae bacterium]|jgi:hypothetical protein|nr:ADP-ribosylglycohydrolase family protein [Tepidisphaeraceae bacterium]